MDKLKNADWQGAIFAKAGLSRVALLGSQFQELKWMIPAPGQGAIGIVCRSNQLKIINKNSTKLKILGTGEIKDKVNIEANLASKSAVEKLEKIGGSIQLKK